MSSLLLIGLATLVSEDLTCIATGVLIAQGRLGFWSGVAACLLGIYAGDLALFLIGRLAGRAALRWGPFRRFVPPAQVERASAWISAKGLVVVFLSRFAPGLRLPTYFVAGLLKTRFRIFAFYFLAAAAVWTPLLVGLAALAGERSARALTRAGRTWGQFAVLFAAALALRWLLGAALSFRIRRRIEGFLKRKVRWEFWPPWLAYLPVVAYIAWLALKHRSLTLFTAANPGMPSGGLLGESKSQILDHLSQVEGAVALYLCIPGKLPPPVRVQAAREFLGRNGLDLPVVLKPDVGERGAGVAIVRSQTELEAYLDNGDADTIIQEYVGGLEFGVFYFRFPGEPRGHILSITEKRFPEVAGDGVTSLQDLILRDARAVCLAGAYLAAIRRPASDVPAAGEHVRLVEIGSHCRGSVFLDGRRLKTPALEEAVDRISKTHPGFFFGRYDVRAPSLEAFRRGLFTVIELNGVSAEATHIYDPAVSLPQAYRSLIGQWRIAFEIGSANRELGAQPMKPGVLLKLIARRFTNRTGRATGSEALVHAGAIEAVD